MGFFNGLKEELGTAMKELMNDDTVVSEDTEASEKLLSDAIDFEQPIDDADLEALLSGIDLSVNVGDDLVVENPEEELTTEEVDSEEPDFEEADIERNVLEEDQMSIDDLLKDLEPNDNVATDDTNLGDAIDASVDENLDGDIADFDLDTLVANASEDMTIADVLGDTSATDENILNEEAVEEPHEMSVQDALDSLKDAGMRYEEKQRFEDMMSIAEVGVPSQPEENISLDIDFAGISGNHIADEVASEDTFSDINTEDDMEEISDAIELSDSEAALDDTSDAMAESNNSVVTEDSSSDKYDFTFSDDTAVITEGMKMKGDIESDGNLDIMGQVDGNVKIIGKLNCFGNVDGDIEAHEIFADGARIKGDINVSGSVKIGKASVILGNISATSAVIAGAVKGNIDVTGPVILDSTAIVMGDVKSMTMQVINGAAIEGHCSQCYAKVSPMSFFNDYNE